MARKLLWSVLAVLAAIGAGILLWLAIKRPASKPSDPQASDHIWAYRCQDKVCVKVLASSPEIAANLSSRSVCKLQCGGHGNLWPTPNGGVTIGDKLATIDVKSISASKHGINPSSYTTLKSAFDLFRSRQQSKLSTLKYIHTGNNVVRMQVYFDINKPSGSGVILKLHTNETYELKIKSLKDGTIQAEITSQNFFGARHALETLDQLIVTDDFQHAIRVPTEVNITDGPSYQYRGILIDTARSFISVDALKRTIDAMGASKLNTLHWHITDSQSFPFESKSYPELTRLGAYSSKNVYSEVKITQLVEYARVRGVRIIPEFDAPAHVGEGWAEFAPGTLVCFKAKPWTLMCQEPPCGQLDPTSKQVYEILEGIYKDMVRSFEPVAFHMGGDEVNFKCWNTSQGIQEWLKVRGLSNHSEESFHDLWSYFQAKSLDKLYASNGGKDIPAIIWTSSLTNTKEADKYLDPKKYIIQVWSRKDDPIIEELAKKKYQMIFSNYDAMYLDCGYGAWVGRSENNWCSPYIGWQKFYDNDPRTLLKNLSVHDPEALSLALGGEAAMWTEQADSSSIDSKIWPRAAAMAERLWSDPTSNWGPAISRFLEHRERLVNLGVFADSIQPEWCLYNEGHCT